MKFEDSQHYQKLKHKKFELAFGNFYFLENLIIVEIKPEKHFGWSKVQELISLIYDYYGENPKIGYISNRVNSYSSEPESWIKVEKKYKIVVASAIVTYNEISYINANIEKKFSNNSMKRCRTLDEAMKWMQNLNEFK